MTDLTDREFVKQAAKALGLTVKELGERIGKKSLERVSWGSIDLHPAQRQHIEDLLTIHKLREERQKLQYSSPPIWGVVSEEPRSLKEPPPSMPPPHASLPLTREAHPVASIPTHKEYAEAVTIIGRLMERSPENFRAALAMLRGINQQTK